MSVQENFRIEVKLQVCIEKTDYGYLASCEQLDLHAEGSSKRKAADSIRDAVSGFLTTCIEMGTLHEVMIDSGFDHNRVQRRQNDVECRNMSIPLHIPDDRSGHGRVAHAC